MIETEARAWIRERFGADREHLLARFVDMLKVESQQQNLIAASTMDAIWVRHIVDSAQLLAYAPADGTWVDIGTGAGLPGIVVACLRDGPIHLVEPRSRRVDFLNAVVQELRLENAVVHHGKIESFETGNFAVAAVSARAVANLGSLFSSTIHCTDLSTIWVLPKGRNAQSEVDAARAKWQGLFHVEQSITQPDSGIVIAREVRPR